MLPKKQLFFFFFKLNDNLYRFKVFYTYDIAMN